MSSSLAIIRNFPLLLIPLIVYNLYSFGIIPSSTPGIWPEIVAQFPMASGATYFMTLGASIILFALVLLFFEVLKATRTARATIVDHLLSTAVFIVYLVQFIVDPSAATTVFFVCLVISLIDVVAGYSISIRVASRDVTFDQGFN